MFQTLVLALVQGITEFLPVSSSGHLILLRYLLKWKSQGMMMDIGLHFGTLLAVCVYFHKDIWNLLKSFFVENQSKKMLVNLIVATLPIPLFALIFLDVIRELRQPMVVAILLIVFGVFLYLADKYMSVTKNKQISIKEAFLIGLAQCLSLFPGVSRSGVTITAARLCKIDRVQATNFSMLLSIPTILLAVLWKVWGCLQQGPKCMCNPLLMYGVLFSFIFGLFCVSFLVKFVKKNTFFAFMIYRIILGCLLLLYI